MERSKNKREKERFYYSDNIKSRNKKDTPKAFKANTMIFNCGLGI